MNDPRRLSEHFPSKAETDTLAARATFQPYAKHKRHPHAYGLKAFRGTQEDPTYCDEHAGFQPADMRRIPELLQRGIKAGLLGDTKKQNDPSMLWTVDDNGWIYEAQITNPGYSVYHAYPVLPNEAIAEKILARYFDFVSRQNDCILRKSYNNARRRYS